MEPEEIKQTLINAFPPYRCVAEIWDYNDRIRFRVFDKNDKSIITVPEIIVNKIKTKIDLESLIQFYKSKIIELGFKID